MKRYLPLLLVLLSSCASTPPINPYAITRMEVIKLIDTYADSAAEQAVANAQYKKEQEKIHKHVEEVDFEVRCRNFARKHKLREGNGRIKME